MKKVVLPIVLIIILQESELLQKLLTCHNVIILITSVVDENKISNHHVKKVRIRSYSGPYFPTFGLNTERYGVSPYLV